MYIKLKFTTVPNLSETKIKCIFERIRKIMHHRAYRHGVRYRYIYIERKCFSRSCFLGCISFALHLCGHFDLCAIEES